MDINVVTKKYRARVIHDTMNNEVVIGLIGKGGPIVSAESREEAERKFSEALSLTCACANLKTYSDALKADLKVKSNLREKMCTSHEIEYVQEAI